MKVRGKKYTHIFFDLDNTLWDFEKNSYHALHAAFNYFDIREKGVEFDKFFSVYCSHNNSLWELYRQKKVVKNELKKLRFQKSFDELNVDGVNANEMNSRYLCEMPKQNRLVEGAKDLLGYLKLKGCHLYIVTNGFKEVQHKKLETSDLSAYFKKTFISEDIRATKPDRKFFEYAIKSANAPKQQSIIIGDSFEIDVKGALNFGIDAVFYNPSFSDTQQKLHPVKHGKNVYYIVSSLFELLKIL